MLVSHTVTRNSTWRLGVPILLVVVPTCIGFGGLSTAHGARLADWGPAVSIESLPDSSSEVNTEFLDGCPIQSPDGSSLFLASNRPGIGGIDLWGRDPRRRGVRLRRTDEPRLCGELRGRRLLPYAGARRRPLLREYPSGRMRRRRHLLHPQQPGPAGAHPSTCRARPRAAARTRASTNSAPPTSRPKGTSTSTSRAGRTSS